MREVGCQLGGRGGCCCIGSVFVWFVVLFLVCTMLFYGVVKSCFMVLYFMVYCIELYCINARKKGKIIFIILFYYVFYCFLLQSTKL